MKQLPVFPLCVFLLGLGVFLPLIAKTPENPKAVPVADLVAEANEQIKSLGTGTESAATYKERQDDIRRAAGVLAVLSQAIAEHPEAKSQKISPLALRDAALELAESDDHAAALEAVKKIGLASQGAGSKEETKKVAWKDLMGMDDLMHVVNTRNSQVIRASRRSRDPEGDSRHALTIAILSYAMADQADDYLSEEADIKAWKKHAMDFQQGMTDLASAIKAQEKASIPMHLAAATKACNDCHAQFRDQPE